MNTQDLDSLRRGRVEFSETSAVSPIFVFKELSQQGVVESESHK